MMLASPFVSLIQDATAEYPEPPFHPDRNYPEYPFQGRHAIAERNSVYQAVRLALKLLKLDSAHYGSPCWNPFGSLIKPGSTVVIKPNAVCDVNYKADESVFASITHASVLRPVIDYAYTAIKGEGRIILADSPLMHSDFEHWKRLTGIHSVVELYKQTFGFEIPVVDMRTLYVPWDRDRGFARSQQRVRNARDPVGYVEVDLGPSSCFADFTEADVRHLYGSDYDRETTVKHHRDGHHVYKVAQTILNADVLISVPKLKVHSKVGVTLNIKGMVGTQGDKNYIPHHRIGDPSRGGDEYPDLGWAQNALNRFRMWMMTRLLGRKTQAGDLAFLFLDRFRLLGQRLIDSWGFRRYGDRYLGNILGGSWYGNDTAWRMSLDLLRIAIYCDKNGILCKTPQRVFFSVVDGVLAGEDEGPLAPTGRKAGVVLAGCNPLAVDTAAARLMGFDPNRIQLLKAGATQEWLKRWTGSLQDIPVLSNKSELEGLMQNQRDPFLSFVPPRGWRGHIEIRQPCERRARRHDSRSRADQHSPLLFHHALPCQGGSGRERQRNLRKGPVCDN